MKSTDKLIHIHKAIGKTWILDKDNPKHENKRSYRADVTIEDKIRVSGETYHSVLPTVMFIGLCHIHRVDRDEVLSHLGITDQEYDNKFEAFLNIMKNIQTRMKRLKGDQKLIKDDGVRRWIGKFKSITEVILPKFIMNKFIY